MKLRAIASKCLRYFLSRSYSRPLANMLIRGKPFCLLLHRIAEKNGKRLACNENMKVSPEYLERFIADARAHGYSFISMSELADRFAAGDSLHKSIAITLDDGYRDNFTAGLPVFVRHSVPFTIYLSTHFIEKRDVPWWYVLEELLLCRDIINYGGVNYSVGPVDLKEKLFLRIREDILNGDAGVIPAEVELVCGDNDFDIESAAMNGLFLTWDEAKNMSDNPLAEIGNHGHRHLNLKKCGDLLVKEEFTTAAEYIKKYTGKLPVHCSYPYGLYDARVENIVNPLCRTVVTTDAKVFSRKSSLSRIPRITLCENTGMNALRLEAACGVFRELLA